MDLMWRVMVVGKIILIIIAMKRFTNVTNAPILGDKSNSCFDAVART